MRLNLGDVPAPLRSRLRTINPQTGFHGLSTALLAVALLPGLDGQVLSRCDQGQSSALEQEARRDMSAKNFETAALKFQEATLACPDDRNLLIERANSR